MSWSSTASGREQGEPRGGPAKGAMSPRFGPLASSRISMDTSFPPVENGDDDSAYN